MRKSLPRSLIAIGLVVAVFAFPSAAWADPGEDKKDKKEHPVEQTLPDEVDPVPPEPVTPEPPPEPPVEEPIPEPPVEEPIPEPPIEEPVVVEEPEPVEEPELPEDSEAPEEEPAEDTAEADEATKAEAEAEAELEEGETEIPINPGNVNNGAGTTAADFEGQSCDHVPGGMAPEGQDGWVFVLPGNDASFVSVSATFAEDGTIDGTVVEGHDGKFAYVLANAGWTLTGATAVITGDTPQSQFNLTHACPGTVVPPPPPPCDDGKEPPCEEPPPCDDGREPPCEEEPPPPCDDGKEPPCEEEPPPPDEEEPPGDDDTPPVTMHPPTQPDLENFVPQSASGGDGLPITGNSLGLLMLIGASLLTAGGLALVLYRVANRARKLGAGVDD